MPDLTIDIVSEPLESIPVKKPKPEGYGAEAVFEGVIRPEEGNSTIQGIRYEAYEGMAVKVIRELLESLALEQAFLAAEVIHRVGDIRVGEAAIRVTVWAKHRKEAFETLSEFMNRLKKDVPIWKVSTF